MPERLPLALLAILLTIPAAAQDRDERPHAYDLESSYVRWPLPEGEVAYGRIDGARMKRWVEEMTAISRRSRDRGDPYWGRIAGARSDQETEAWVKAKFESLGLDNVHSQPFELAPQWFPTSWEASLEGPSSTIALDTAHPAKGSPPTPEEVEFRRMGGGPNRGTGTTRAPDKRQRRELQRLKRLQGA